MKIKRILKGILKWISFAILLALFVGIILLFVAYWRSTNDCDRLTDAQGDKMKAIVYCDYGLANLKLADVAKPTPTDDQILVKVHAASVNPLDWHFIEGTPKIMRALGVGLRKPKDTRLGVDFAGTVEVVGKNVTQFKPGDEVFGGRDGAFAEYVCPRADRAVTLKPANITFEQAASVNIAGITALQAVRDKGKVQPGQKVLINGASGGVGTFAVQIAKSFGADVTGVCSTRNLDMVRSLGVPNHSLSECRRVLNPQGKYVMIGGGGPNDNRWIGPFGRLIQALVVSPFVSQKMGMMMAELKKSDLAILGDMMQSGKVKPVIDRTYKLSELPAAIAYLEEGHARGKVVITVE